MSGNYLLFPQDGKVRVTSPFGMRNGRLHSGVDLASDNKGVDWNLASADGTVTNVGYSKVDIGHWLEIKLDFKISGKVAYIRYYHMKESPKFYDRKGTPKITKGSKIKQGEKIGIEGSTGNSTGNHLHFELRLGGSTRSYAVDPIPYLRIKRGMLVDRGSLTQSQFKNVRYTDELEVDGKWGPATTRALQRYFHTPEDGMISKPSMVIRIMQGRVGAKQDGYLGPETIRKMQKHFGTSVDGVISKPSMMVKEMQRQLNKGKF